MRRILEDKEYTFNASDQSIDFDFKLKIKLNDVLIITNLNGNSIIYNFACKDFGGTLFLNRLTLEFDTEGMSNDDILMITIEQEVDLTVEELRHTQLINCLQDINASIDTTNKILNSIKR